MTDSQEPDGFRLHPATVTRAAGDWRGDPPAGQLVMQATRLLLAADEPGWVTLYGWRHVDGKPGPQWVTVEVRIPAAEDGSGAG